MTDEIQAAGARSGDLAARLGDIATCLELAKVGVKDWPDVLREAQATITALHAEVETRDRPEPIPQPQSNRPQPIRRDLARLLDHLYGLHVRPGHIDAVLEVINLHAPVKVPLDGRSELEARITALTQEKEILREFIDILDDRSLSDLAQAHKEGLYSGDVHDAPDDCETQIVVTRGELRRVRGR